METGQEGIRAFWSERRFLEMVQVCRATLSKFKKKKAFVYYKVGRRCLYDAESLITFKENCMKRIGSGEEVRGNVASLQSDSRRKSR